MDKFSARWSPATAALGTAASWPYHLAKITDTRRLLAVSTRNDVFQDSRPDLDVVSLMVLRETPLYSGAHFRPFRPIPCSIRYVLQRVLRIFADYVTTLPIWERELLVSCNGEPSRNPFVSSVATKGCYQDETCDFDLLSRPEQLNIVVDNVATDALMDVCTADKTAEFFPSPACRVYLRDGSGYITSQETRTLTNKFLGYEIQAYIQQGNNWTVHIYDPTSRTTYRSAISLLTDVRSYLIKLSRNWLPVGHSGTPMRRYN
jgi:hypothetical protein